MKKPKVDERAIKVAADRLVREIKIKKNLDMHWYLEGYKEAIFDFVWDYARTPLICLEWEQYLKEQINKGKVKVGTIPIKDIKQMKGGKN